MNTCRRCNRSIVFDADTNAWHDLEHDTLVFCEEGVLHDPQSLASPPTTEEMLASGWATVGRRENVEEEDHG